MKREEFKRRYARPWNDTQEIKLPDIDPTKYQAVILVN